MNNSFAERIAALKRKNNSRDSSINESANSLFPFGVSFLSQGFIPNFIDRRNRAQKIKDVLADPANKNIKFNSPLNKKMSIDTVKKGMGGEFQKMWLESYFKTGRVGDYQMLMKMGYDPDKLKALRKHSEQGGQVDIKTMANGMIPNFAMRRGDLRRYTQQVHTQGIKDPKGKLFFKGEKYKEVKFDSPQSEKDKASWIKPSYQTIQGDRNEIKEFSKYLETRKDIKPYVVENFKKEYSKELKFSEDAQKRYWETYDRIKSGDAGVYERNGFFGRKTMPSEDPLKVQLKYLKKDQIDNLVSDFKKQQKPSFSRGYIPNFVGAKIGMNSLGKKSAGQFQKESLEQYFEKEFIGKRFNDLNKIESSVFQTSAASGGLGTFSQQERTSFVNSAFSAVAKTFKTSPPNRYGKIKEGVKGVDQSEIKNNIWNPVVTKENIQTIKRENPAAWNSLVEKWNKSQPAASQFVSNAAEGYVPNFTDSKRQKIELGRYSDVSSVVNERGKTLDIGMIMSGMNDSGQSIYKKLLKEIEKAAKEGKPYTRINAGAIIGPRIPKLLLAAKKY